MRQHIVIFMFLFATACGSQVQPPSLAPPIPGPKGDTGAAGSEGPKGDNGSDGSNGTDATPVTVVTLCPGVTSYPGVFVEVALCLGGNLYGVYSANGGFLTLLPPGNYTSAGIGSACNLTVGPNCTVTH